MKNRKWIAFICLLLVGVIFATACKEVPEGTTSTTGTTQGTTAGKSDTNSNEGQNGNQNNNDNSIENNEKAECNEHDYKEVSRVDAMALKDGDIKYECSKCQDNKTEKIPATKSVKILALGNSFTDDSTEHLWNICKDGGAETVIVGNLYVGNCTLDKHWTYISGNQAKYIFRKNVNGTIVNTKEYKIIDALKEEDWDYIVLHQTSGSAGFANTFTKLDNIINFLNQNKTNPNAKIVWHMPWAYQSDSTHAEFAKYDSNQLKMYREIVSRVKEIILAKDTISAVIPSGTAIQNLRTSWVGDKVTRDGYHLNYGFGRYAAALAWYATITGGDVDVVDWIPTNYPEVKDYLPAIKEAVKGAMSSSYDVTISKLLTKPDTDLENGGSEIDPSVVLNPADFIEVDKTLAAKNGVDLTKYKLLEWDYVENAYWHCTERTNIYHPGSSKSTYNQNICTDKKFSVDSELPAGSIFICDEGWRFLIDIFPNENEIYKGTRPSGVTDAFYMITEEFLNGCKYIAWNVSSYPKTDISSKFAEAATHIRVYVPKR